MFTYLEFMAEVVEAQALEGMLADDVLGCRERAGCQGEEQP